MLVLQVGLQYTTCKIDWCPRTLDCGGYFGGGGAGGNTTRGSGGDGGGADGGGTGFTPIIPFKGFAGPEVVEVDREIRTGGDGSNGGSGIVVIRYQDGRSVLHTSKSNWWCY